MWGQIVQRSPGQVLESLEQMLDGILEDAASFPQLSSLGVDKRVAESEEEGRRGSFVDDMQFREWERMTEELQGVPRPEEVDLPGDKTFTDGCLKVGTDHACEV